MHARSIFNTKQSDRKSVTLTFDHMTWTLKGIIYFLVATIAPSLEIYRQNDHDKMNK